MSHLKDAGAQQTNLDDAAPDDSVPHLDHKLWGTIGNILDTVYDAVTTGQPLDELEKDG